MSKGINVTMFNNAMRQNGDNLAAKSAVGYKGRRTVFVSSFINAGSSAGGGAGYVTSNTRSSNTIQGKVVSTGVSSDIAIDGGGFFVVSNGPGGAKAFARDGSFRQGADGYWSNSGGKLLQAWKLNADGSLPQNSSNLESLEAVNFADLKVLPKATTRVSIGMNLNAEQEALRGDGVNASLNRTGINAAKFVNDLIYPEMAANSRLAIGDSFLFGSSSGSKPQKKVTFGGIVAGVRASANTPIFGGQNQSATFHFANTAAPGFARGPRVLVNNDQLRITVGNGQSYLFTAQVGAEDSSAGIFSSLSGFANAISKTGQLRASIDNTGRLYVAPVDPQASLTFTNVGDATIAQEFGLSNLASAAADQRRFNTMGTLRDAVNADQDAFSLKATTEGQDVKITALLSSSTFTVGAAAASGKQQITQARNNPNDNELGRATTFIAAANHGLQPGDLVRVNGLAAGGPANGLYAVARAFGNGFEICLRTAVANFPAVGARVPIVPAADAGWEKVGGTQQNPVKAGQVTAANAGAGGAITITLAAHGLAVNDVIYTDGGLLRFGAGAAGHDISLPRGYYTVAGVAGGNIFTITAANVAAAAAAAAGYAGDNISFRKIGTTAAAAAPAFDSVLFATPAGVGDIATYYIGSNTYNVGDNIKFTNLDPAGLRIAAAGAASLMNNTNYKIVAVDRNAGTVQLECAGIAEAAAATARHTQAANIGIDYGSQLIKYFNIDPSKTQYDPTYDATNVDKNLSASVNGQAKFDSKLTYSVPVSIYDSLGTSTTVMLNFAKLDNNQWAVELTAQKDKNSVFDITNTITSNGLIKQGILKFDSNGKLQGAPQGMDGVIPIQRNNGSAPIELTIDWANVLGDLAGSVTQTKYQNDVQLLRNDGFATGMVVGVTVGPTGILTGICDNGQTVDVYKIPMAVFPDPDGLTASGDGTWIASKESGQFILKEAGVGGAGKTLGGALEESNVNSTDELMSMQAYSRDITLIARTVSIESESEKSILAELR